MELVSSIILHFQSLPGKSPLGGFHSSEDRIEKAYPLRGPNGTHIVLVLGGPSAHIFSVTANPRCPSGKCSTLQTLRKPLPLHNHASSEIQWGAHVPGSQPIGPLPLPCDTPQDEREIQRARDGERT